MNNKKPKLTLSMIVKNEENRYLKQVLESAVKYIDEAVIIDDNSEDNTIKICEEILCSIPTLIIKNKKTLFHQEALLRKLQWDETIKTNPEWILFLDADEIFEEDFENVVTELLQSDNYLFSFRLYDFWDMNHYREDSIWCAHKVYRPFLLKYCIDFEYEFSESNQHCGRMPKNVFRLKNALSEYRVKHYGWAKEEDRMKKYNRYMELDPNGVYGSLIQYNSILDENPNLVQWSE